MTENLNQFLADSFEDALEKRHIQVYYQPVIRTVTRQACSFEALSRWIDPARGMIRPDEFISHLEDRRLIHRLDAYVIREVCSTIRRTIDGGYYPIPISVNLSALDISMCDMFAVTIDTVREFRIPTEYLYIEITESLFAENEKKMQEEIERFRGAGFQVWMDDFGSGYSSLNTLKDFSFDQLKVDMGFLSNFTLRSRKILTSVIGMAKDIGIHTLVEGVETEDHYSFLKDIGCEKIQGYLFGQPAPYEETLDHLRQIGVPIEYPKERRYFDAMGTVNVLSASPFMSFEQRDNLDNALQLNSIPLAMAEIRGALFRPLYCNAAFEQVIADTQWGEGQSQMGSFCSADLIPRRSLGVIEESRDYGESKQYFIANGDYYELRSKCVAKSKEAYCVLLQLDNLSRSLDFSRLSALDAEMRHIYSVFDRVALFDLEADRYTPIYVGANDKDIPEQTTSHMLEDYRANEIFPEDRAAFRSFFELSSIEERIRRSGSSHITAFFRTRDPFGEYAWKQHLLVHIRPGAVFSVIRDADEDVQAMRQRFPSPASPRERLALDDGHLWKSLTGSGIPRVYWKDPDRRYIGVSPGFLEFFGFSSADALIGKTDEDIHWHILEEHTIHRELRVLREGAVIKNQPVTFITGGVSRAALCSSAPIYDENGKVAGLVGWLCEPTQHSAANADEARTDGLTGLLNPRGILEELHYYCDMYELRQQDFVRIHVAVEDFHAIILQYGYDHGDAVIKALGRALSRLCGNDALVGRATGHHFVILHQYREPEKLAQMTADIKSAGAQIREVDGIPCTLYLSVGACAFSECRDTTMQAQLAENRLLADQHEETSVDVQLSRAGTLFQMYDNLPLSFAVYRLEVDPDTKELHARFFYVNHRFAVEQNKTPDEIIGQDMREIFPDLEPEWYDTAQRAAFLSEEVVVENTYYECMKTHYRVTASQIIRPGYCVFTYQPLDGPFAARE